MVPGQPRANIYNWDKRTLLEYRHAGLKHAMAYPVDVTGLLIPYKPLKRFFKGPFINEMFHWIGLNPYNTHWSSPPYETPTPDLWEDDLPMGATLIEKADAVGLTYSCAACHTANLFGRSVVGLTNKQPRANQYFVLAKKYVPHIPSPLFQALTGATEAERQMFRRSRNNLLYVGVKKPEVLGLDTSLAQVALSLSRRGQDGQATKSIKFARQPRQNALSTFVADSKPMVWWNLKYKNRWLSDGSIVSGNPVLTNFLWNEIGRGTDLNDLKIWMLDNQDKIRQLTTAVFASEPPRYTDFVSSDQINLDQVIAGEQHFKKLCANCHGLYEKGYHSYSLESPMADLLATTRVWYHAQTPVIDVETDPQRSLGMQHFSEHLNRLDISQQMKTLVVPQKGYVPPPLEGVWARYPYMHNNSMPNLCAVLSLPKDRPTQYYQGPAHDIQTDFDHECVGYPTGKQIPKHFRQIPDGLYQVGRPGLSNSGHWKMLVDQTGREHLSSLQKRELIEYLKVL